MTILPVERLALAHSSAAGSVMAWTRRATGVVAILHVQHRHVDAVLLDLHMPDVDGFDVLGYLQKHRRALPVILMSGMPLNKIQHKIHALPVPELPPLLIKPIDPDQLLGILELQLNGVIPPGGPETSNATRRTLGLN